MDGGDNILDSIFEENLEDVEDVEMLDVEEGELTEQNLKTEVGQCSSGYANITCQESQNKNRRRRSNKKKHKRKKGNSGPNVTDVNRFVLDVCRRLKERKSYLVWTAVGCLGVSAFSDLVKELFHLLVDAIQACGGQKTADGRRYRTGGGILWGILKVRDPNAYKEIMKKGNEFEKQFKQHDVKQPPRQNKATSSQVISVESTDQSAGRSLDGSRHIYHIEDQLELSFVEQKRPSVHDRIRVPVAYDDLPGVEDSKDELVHLDV